MNIATVDAERFSIPLPETLSDSTHGEMSLFELVAVRIRDNEGVEGLGYTYTVGNAANAILSLIRDDITPLLIEADASRIEDLWQKHVVAPALCRAWRPGLFRHLSRGHRAVGPEGQACRTTFMARAGRP